MKLPLLLLASLAIACASVVSHPRLDDVGPPPPLRGESVVSDEPRVWGHQAVVYGFDGHELHGELQAIAADGLWLNRGGTPHKVALHDIAYVEVVLERDSNLGTIIGVGVGGTLSTVTHGFFLVITAPVWVLSTTGLAIAEGVSASSTLAFDAGDWWTMRHYARFPQGMPPANALPVVVTATAR